MAAFDEEFLRAHADEIARIAVLEGCSRLVVSNEDEVVAGPAPDVSGTRQVFEMCAEETCVGRRSEAAGRTRVFR